MKCKLNIDLKVRRDNKRYFSIIGYVGVDEGESFVLRDRQDVLKFIKEENERIELALKQLEDIKKMSEEL